MINLQLALMIIIFTFTIALTMKDSLSLRLTIASLQHSIGPGTASILDQSVELMSYSFSTLKWESTCHQELATQFIQNGTHIQ